MVKRRSTLLRIVPLARRPLVPVLLNRTQVVDEMRDDDSKLLKTFDKFGDVALV
jgi:hypothetical protein